MNNFYDPWVKTIALFWVFYNIHVYLCLCFVRQFEQMSDQDDYVEIWGFVIYFSLYFFAIYFSIIPQFKRGKV